MVDTLPLAGFGSQGYFPKYKTNLLLFFQLTWADIFFICFYEAARSIFRGDIFAVYPNLTRVKQNVLSVPAIRKYLQNRKENKYYSYDLKSEV